MRWNFTRALSFEYTARANAIIDEPQGDLDTQEKKDSVINNLKNLGRMKNFDQTVTVNYTLPLDKFPVTDWLGAEYRYQAGFNWKAGPVNIDDSLAKHKHLQDLPDDLDFKNTIQNSRENNLTGKIDMVKLYNKIKFLKELNTPPKPPPTTRQQPGKQQPGKPAPKQVAKVDTTKTTPGAIKGLFRLLMSLRSINGTYTLTEGTILPGYIPTPKFLGMDQNWDSPGWGFLLGDQDPELRNKAAQKQWLIAKSSLTTPFSQIRSEVIGIRASVEPSQDFKIQLDIKKEGSTSFQEIFKFDSTVFEPANDPLHGFRSFNPTRSGSYKISFLSINTAFDKTNSSVNSNVFAQFEENLQIIRSRFRSLPHQGEYDTTSQDVVIPAFLAAYGGNDARTISLSPFPRTPMPNWRIDYNGLNKIELFKEIFQSVTLSHGYQSSYSVVSYTNSQEYMEEFGDPSLVSINKPVEKYNESYFGGNVDGKFIPVYVISQVLISEQFSPLIGVNIRTKSRMTVRADYKTKRDLSLNIPNAQVTELNSKDVSFELGYTKNNMKLPFKSQGRTIVLKNDVTFRMNLTVSDSKTIQRKIDDQNYITNGNINFQLRPNISYVVNQKLTLQGYFERTLNKPQVTNSYPRATTRFGIQVRFSLAQ